jgi:hypothetical protein
MIAYFIALWMALLAGQGHPKNPDGNNPITTMDEGGGGGGHTHPPPPPPPPDPEEP